MHGRRLPLPPDEDQIDEDADEQDEEVDGHEHRRHVDGQHHEEAADHKERDREDEIHLGKKKMLLCG